VRLAEEHDPRQPLFLFVAFTAPHLPLQAPEECFEEAAPAPALARAVYSAMVTCMDEAIGRILRAFQRGGYGRNTLVLFASDNGSTFLGGGSNAPLRGGKGSLYEGGVRVPAVLAWPGRLRGGRVYPHPLHAVDVHATLLRLAGATPEPSLPADGVDAWEGLRRGEPVRSELLHNISPFGSALRLGTWKLVSNPSRYELYHVALDPLESTDLAPQLPDRVGELKARLDEYRRQALPPQPWQPQLPPGYEVPEVWGPRD
jgi:arylsulfatase A-like enzyme